MNAKNYLLNMLLVGSSIMMLASCVKNDVYDPDKAPKKTEDLVVPDGFDWKNSQDVTVTMTSPRATSVAVYTDKSCTQQIAELPVEKGENSITMEVPMEISNLWFEYALASGGKEVKEVPIQKTKTRAGVGEPLWSVNVIFPDNIDNSDYYSLAFYQPSKNGFGTVMFEDRWPETADYDFNDFVVNYNVKAQGHLAADNEHLDYTTLTVTLKLRAMGGSLPYRFCMQIGHRFATDAAPGTVDGRSMELLRKYVELTGVNSNFEGGSVEMIEGTKYVILALNGFDRLRGISGGSFYNTEKAHLYSGETPTITFTLKINETQHRNDNPYKKALFEGFGGQTAFDYFLQKTDGTNREIHLIDWMPTELYKNYAQDAGTSSPEVYYCSNKNFVWGLKVPQEIAWPVERQDIIGVYPFFSEWIKSGGYLLEDNVHNIVWYTQSGRYLTKDNNLYIKP